MISSIFTGYLTTPRILVDQEVTNVPLDVRPSTLAFLHKSMRWAVTQGTGVATSKIKDIHLYVKTSSAQTSRLNKRLLGKKYLEHGLITCYVIYKDTPLTLVILLENSGGSQPAVLVARQFLIEYKKLIDEQEKAL
jgi:cell division protein FtsI/penicillin-binding protein 2